jgi:hypothetical protein
VSDAKPARKAENTDEKIWAEVRLKRRPKGPRRRRVFLGSGYSVFQASQENPKAEDYPLKRVYVSRSIFEQLRADSDYQVREVDPPRPNPKSLGFAPASRTIPTNEVTEPVTQESPKEA